MLNIHVSNTYISERSYIVETLFHNFLGVEFNIIIENRDDVFIKTSEPADEKGISISDFFFKTLPNKWLKSTSLPNQPLKNWLVDEFIRKDISLTSENLPIIYGEESKNNSYIKIDNKNIHLGIDVFGSAFFMLTRYEELVKKDRDEHDRFPATASLAYQEGFLDRPIINEYIEILWYCIKQLWPNLKRKKRSFRTTVSHDVDIPFAQTFSGLSVLIRNCAGDVLKHKSLILALQRMKSWQAIKRGNYKQDLNYTFDRIMDISEQHNLISAFYFKTVCTNKIFDDNYSIDHPYIRQLLKDIYSRGHEIGVHPSYETYHNPEQTKAEFQKLLQVCEEEGIKQEKWGGRQHYLRWDVPVTWRNWNEAGLDYDSTLSYADHAGFRCGICYEFPVYDLEERKQLALIERPLILMEGSILGKKYMNLKGQVALDYMILLKQHCRKYSGDFTLLWHNNTFLTKEMWKIYEDLLIS